MRAVAAAFAVLIACGATACGGDAEEARERGCPGRRTSIRVLDDKS